MPLLKQKASDFQKQIVLPLWIIVIFLLFVVLYIGRDILILLTFTAILLILFSGIYSFFYKKSDSNIGAAIGTAVVFIAFFGIIGFIISTQIESFTENSGQIGEGFDSLISSNAFVSQYFGSINFQNIFSRIDLQSIGANALGVISGITGGLITVGFLLIFILIEKDQFKKKIDIIFDDRSEEKIENIYTKIYSDLNTFIISKFAIATLNGLVSGIIMLLFGLEFALLFALFVFLLDFIPSVGGAIAMALPFLYSFVQFDHTYMSFLLLACLIIPQTITGNMIEPKVMGDRLNLSSLIILLSLIFWSTMWGVAGAFLAVPLMAAINIVLSKFEITKPIAVFLSQNGKVSS